MTATEVLTKVLLIASMIFDICLGFFILSLVAMIFWRHGFVHGVIAVLIIVFVGGWVRFFVNGAFGLVAAILNRKSLN
jgi:hypothetical protein